MSKYGQPNRVSKTISDDKHLITYRPKLNKITGSVTATLLLQQAMYWADVSGNEFYKFIQPCKHDRYKQGDSWTEELGFTKHEFNTAIKKIGFKRGRSGKNEIEKEEDAYIIYYTTSQRLTYWVVNWNKINKDLDKLYSNPEYLVNPECGNTKEKKESGITKANPECGNTITSKTTTKTNTKTSKQRENSAAIFDNDKTSNIASDNLEDNKVNEYLEKLKEVNKFYEKEINHVNLLPIQLQHSKLSTVSDKIYYSFLDNLFIKIKNIKK